MKLSEIRGEKALDVISDLIEPITEIFADQEFASIIRSNKPKVLAVKCAIKKHKKAVLTVLAILDEEDPATYNPSLLSIPMKLLDVLNDPELAELFPSVPQTSDQIS